MKSIRQQLTRKLLLSVSILLAFGVVGAHLATREALLEQFDDTLRAKASAIASSVEQRGKDVGVEISDKFLRESDEHVPVEFFQLRYADGSNICRSRSLGEANLPLDVGTTRRPQLWNLTLPTGYRGRAIGYTFSAPESREGKAGVGAPVELSIVVAFEVEELNQTLAVLALVLAGCGTLLVIAIGLLVPRILRREFSPLDKFADYAGRINADSLDLRFPANGLPSELAPISNRLNDLLARLQRAFEHEREFSSDLAHELRTPIAELRSLAEFGLQWPESRGDQANADAVAIADQMEKIVSQLLALRRSETGQLTVARERISVAVLVNDIWKPLEQAAKGKNLRVGRTLPEEMGIESDPVLLRSILTNLLENAVEYTPRGGALRIGGETGYGWFTVRVANTVADLEAADLPKLFERFWRKDSARANQKHSGLGLSLALAFARVLGCELRAALDGAALVLTLSGPLSTTQAISGSTTGSDSEMQAAGTRTSAVSAESQIH